MNKVIALVVASFLLLTGFVSAIGTTTQLQSTGNSIAEFSNLESYSVPKSAHLQADEIIDSTNEGRVKIEFTEDTILNDIDSISWMQYVVTGYAAHVDIKIDTDGDGISDDVLVFEYDKVDTPSDQNLVDMEFGRDEWINTFDGKGIVDEEAIGWLGSGAPGPAEGTGFISGTLGDWKVGIEDVDSNTKVTSLEIEVDGWIAESEAYIDDIKINDELIQDFETNQEVTGEVESFIEISVSPSTLNFGSIPYGLDVTKSGSDITIDSSSSSTTEEEIIVEVSITEDESGFYTELLEFNIDGLGTWTDISTTPSLILPAEESETFGTRIQGNTAEFGAGEKNAVLTYTAFGETPE